MGFLKLKSKKNNQDNFFINNTTTSFKVLVSNQVGYDPEFVEPKFNTLDNKGFLSQSRPNVSNATPANRNEETEIVVTGKPMVEEERLLFNNTETATLEPKETLYNLQVQTTNPNIPIRGSSQQPLPEVNKFKKLKNPTLQNLIVNDLHQNHTLSPPTVTTPLTATIDEIANPRDSTFFKNIYN
ncbi:hypothetical protein HK099_007661 [Clydaea vesicula]|uniref:Uncharacterized protein n=1 Tax=Clydaea vesicula TaxID=447962 RepID=A0AAD5XXF0_9FUNG|nr:hypothetical protein HK099_007661 [Clydaea vesicula]